MEPKACPHCGAAVELIEIPPHKHMSKLIPDHPGSWYIECACGAGMLDEDREKLLERWNRRAGPLEGGTCKPSREAQRRIVEQDKRIAQLERERDAAVKSHKIISNFHRDCCGCYYFETGCPLGYAHSGDCWKWRGVADGEATQ